MSKFNSEVRALARKLTFVPVSETSFYRGRDFIWVAHNDEFVLFFNGSVIEWVSMNGHYSGKFKQEFGIDGPSLRW